jgi:hypothetical protein
MPNRTGTYAVILGLAAVAAWSTTTLAAQRQRAPADSYENRGALPNMPPPVPGFALSTYRPGMCWKVRGADYQDGRWIPCSEFFKRR